MGNKNTIEFNGQVYDAATGKVLKAEPPTRPVKPKAADGFIKSKPSADHSKATPKRSPATKHQSHQPARSQTLMRGAVKKPSGKPIDQIQAPTKSKPAKAIKATPLAARLNINERRLARAQQTGKSRAVSRFRSNADDRVFAKLEPLPIKKPSSVAASRPGKVARNSSAERLSDILATSLARATSHEQPSPTAKGKNQRQRGVFRSKWFYIISVIVIVLAVGSSLLAYFSTNIQLAIAEDRSGVHISLPSDKPAGFNLSKATKNADGSLTIDYASKNGQQFYILAQNSNWDSQTLLDSVVMPANSHYQTTIEAGRTVYIYGPGAATWVNDGIWYEIGGDASLSNAQLATIATSM